MTFNFKGHLIYEPEYMDEYFSGWLYCGDYFSASLWDSKAVEIRKEDNTALTWSYRIMADESMESFFMNLLNGLSNNAAR